MCYSSSEAWTYHQVRTATLDRPELSTDILSYSSITSAHSRLSLHTLFLQKSMYM